jgi:hypothetical protein
MTLAIRLMLGFKPAHYRRDRGAKLVEKVVEPFEMPIGVRER